MKTYSPMTYIMVAVHLIMILLFTTPVCAQSWQLVWSDEFDTQIGSDWIFETGGGNELWGNNELENYQLNNTAIENGSLVIIAKKETVGGFNYTSARLVTRGNKSWMYGKIEARIKVPFVTGTWPAFWMMGDHGYWPACGEIDIMEQVNESNIIEGTAHWYDQNDAESQGSNYEETSSGGYTTINGLDSSHYHVYTVEWDQTQIKWFVDGIQYFNTATDGKEQTEFQQPFYLILNLAIGGDMTGNVQPDDSGFPTKMYIDYVRVYQRMASASSNSGAVKDKILIYPNFVSSQITIETIQEKAILFIYNINGQELIKQQIVNNNPQVDISKLPNGVYFVKIQGKKGVEAGKFIKTNITGQSYI